MTKEEAIEFGNMWLQINEDCKDSNTYEFFQMAIKVLEQEPTAKNNLGVDAVSRKAVHDMLENLPITVEDKWFNWLQKACMRLAELPSITPSRRKIGHKVSGDLLGGLYCSECMTYVNEYFNYCPHCGVKMESEG